MLADSEANREDRDRPPLLSIGSRRRVRCLTLTMLCLPTLLFAQDPLQWFVVDSTLDAIFRLEDLDGDQTITASEVSLFYDDSSAGPDLSTPNSIIPWNSGYLVTDGGTLDAIFYLEDLNDDGDALDPGEIRPFFDDSSLALDLSVPNGLAIGSDGSLFVCDDGSSVRSILRMIDLDANGDMLGAGEVSIYFDQSSPAIDPLTDPESVATAPDGSVIVGDSASGRVVRLRDLDGDGTALGAGEATVLYDASGLYLLSDIESIQVDGSGRIFVVDEDSGTVLIMEDLNGDGDCLDPEETVTFYDGMAPGASVQDPNAAILIGPYRLALVDGALDTLIILEDLDGDGTALSPDETRALLDDGGLTLSTPSGLAVPATVGPPPGKVTIDSIEPMVGDAAGETPVTILGSGWTQNSSIEIRFGEVAVPATITSATTLSAIAPAHPPSLVDVMVVADGGSDLLVGAFRYQHRFLRGDVDLNGVLQLGDAITLFSYLFVMGAETPPCLDAGDTADDDDLDLEDGIRLLQYLFAAGPPPASPFPIPGFDPTPLGPGCLEPINVR